MTGVIGLGRMGSGIAATLLRGGYDLAVYDVDSSRVETIGEKGGKPSPDVDSLCTRCDTIILSLPSSDVTVRVIETEILPAAGGGTTIIDMGTTLVRETRRLCAELRQKSVELLDAPVSGGTEGAMRGELFVFAGGDRSTFEKHQSLLGALAGARLTYCGDSGNGQVVKASNQLAMGLVDAAYLEAVAFGVTAGVQADVLSEAIGGESGFRRRFREIADRIEAGEGEEMDAKYPEYGYFLDEAKRSGFPAPILTAVHSFLEGRAKTGRDNMDRPYPPFWSALTESARGTTSAKKRGGDS